MRGSLDVGQVQHYAGRLLHHLNQAEVLRLLVQGEEADEGVVVEEDEGAPRLEEGKEVGCSQAALEGGVAPAGGGCEEVARKEGVLLKHQDQLVGVEPVEPLLRFQGAERPPKVDQWRLPWLPKQK